MFDAKDEVETRVSPLTARQYTAGAAPRHRSSYRRRFFFALAAVWGCIVGIAGLLAVVSFSGRHIDADAGVLLGLLPALVLAAAGGLVIAGAYKESKRHSR